METVLLLVLIAAQNVDKAPCDAAREGGREMTMHDDPTRFVGSIPDYYDKGMGPVIFAEPADVAARRVLANAGQNSGNYIGWPRHRRSGRTRGGRRNGDAPRCVVAQFVA